MNCSQFKILLYAFKLALLTSFQSKYSFDFAVRAPAQNTRAYSQTVAGFCYIDRLLIVLWYHVLNGRCFVVVLQSLCVSGYGEDGACVQHNRSKLGR